MKFHFLNPEASNVFLQHSSFTVHYQMLPQRRQISLIEYCQVAMWAAAPCGPRARSGRDSPGWQQDKARHPRAGQPGMPGQPLPWALGTSHGMGIGQGQVGIWTWMWAHHWAGANPRGWHGVRLCSGQGYAQGPDKYI